MRIIITTPTILLFLFLSCASFVNAQLDFSVNETVIPLNHFPQMSLSVDFDLDGDLDIVSMNADTGSKGNSRVVWWKNDGNKHFSELIRIGEKGFYGRYVAVEDVDGDGDLDVIASFLTRVVLFRNDGGLNFGKGELVSTIFNDNGVHFHLKDLDGDGDVDLSYTEGFPVGDVAILYNDGTGDFGNKQIVQSSIGPGHSLQNVVDMDGDGDVDLLCLDLSTQTIVWIENMGTSGFGTVHSYYAYVNFNDPYVLDIADFNLDGFNDIYTVFRNGSSLYYRDAILYGTSNGTLGTVQLMDSAQSSFSGRIVELNNDGYADLLRSHSDSIAVLFNDGSGGFSSAQQTSLSLERFRLFTSYDYDGDGDNDLFGSHRENPFTNMGTIENLGGGNLAMLVDEVSSVGYGELMDVDGDTDLDFVGMVRFYNPALEHKMLWVENTGGTSFTTQREIPMMSLNPSKFLGTDLDGDGSKDLLILFRDSGTIKWKPNSGSGQFGVESLIHSGASNSGDVLKSYDVDQDGDMDVLVSDSSDVVIYLNDGSGSFIQGQTISTTCTVLSEMILGDLDGDGNADLVVGSGADSKTVIFLANGNGTFGSAVILASTYAVVDLAIGDMDNDSDQDVVISAAVNGQCVWLANDGSGGVDSVVVFLDGSNWAGRPRTMDLGDLDGDGSPDLVIALTGGFTHIIRAYLNDGSGKPLPNGALVESFPYSSPSNPRLIDFDNDGDMDVYAGADRGDWVRLYSSSVTSPPASLRLKLFLEGPYDVGTGLMNADLISEADFPANCYSIHAGFPPFNTSASTGNFNSILVNNTGSDAIVDWVRVELRSAQDPSCVVYGFNGLVKRDGHVVTRNGEDSLLLPFSNADSYYLAVRHRNHLGVMTSMPIVSPGADLVVDLTDPSVPTYGIDARKTVNGVALMWMGNTTNDGNLKYTGSQNDRDAILARIGGTVPTSTIEGYFAEDSNLDHLVKYAGSNNDRDPILVNVGGSVPTNVRVEQLP